MLQQNIYMKETVLYAIFLDLRKAYDALDRDQCIDILSGYEVGPRTIRILQTYWVGLQVAAKAGGRYLPALQSHYGVTQGKPLSPMIFNVFVYAVIRHWVTAVLGGQEGTGQEGLETSILSLSLLLYANWRNCHVAR